jgi:hypothetical protein
MKDDFKVPEWQLPQGSRPNPASQQTANNRLRLAIVIRNSRRSGHRDSQTESG